MMLRGPSTAGPKVPLFGGPKKRKQKQQMQDDKKALQEQARQQAIEEAAFAVKAETADFLTYYLERSAFRDQSDLISIAWENLPSLSQLESYGDLDSTDGTRACRRLFKAVVIWDELGHDLWEMLSSSSYNQAFDAPDKDDTTLSLNDLHDLHEIDEDEPSRVDYTTPTRSSSRASSRCSDSTWFAGRSRQTSADRHRDQSQDSRRPSAQSSRTPSRRGTAPNPLMGDYFDSPSRYRLPKIMTGGCSNAAKRTFGSVDQARSGSV